MLSWLGHECLDFPPLEKALKKPDGLLAAGGDLSPERLINAYRHGCFPWYEDGQPLLWWSPDPRCVLFTGTMHISRSLARCLRRQMFSVTLDQDFAAVIHACAQPRDKQDSTWITAGMQAAYIELHRMGVAHSVEVWRDGKLQGGLYGLAMGRMFFAESMFSRQSNASKVALACLMEKLAEWRFILLDCQVSSPHLHSLGARNIPRHEFAALLARHVSANFSVPEAGQRPITLSWKEK